MSKIQNKISCIAMIILGAFILLAILYRNYKLPSYTAMIEKFSEKESEESESESESEESKEPKPVFVPISQRIDRIYYINLAHREDRKREFLSNFCKQDQQERIERIDAHYVKTHGAFGCLKSHISTIEKAIADGEPDDIVAICEDDLHIKDMHRLNKVLEWGMDSLPRWDAIMLGHNTHESKDTEYVTDSGDKIIRIQHSATTAGYIMRVKYLPNLLAIYKRCHADYLADSRNKPDVEFPGKYCVDVAWVPLQKRDHWFAFVPTVAVQRKSYSDIQMGVVDYGI